MDCFSKHDLNPRTCHFSMKCKKGFERNEKFLCRKTLKNKSKLKSNISNKEILNEPNINEYQRLVKFIDSQNISDYMILIYTLLTYFKVPNIKQKMKDISSKYDKLTLSLVLKMRNFVKNKVGNEYYPTIDENKIETSLLSKEILMKMMYTTGDNLKDKKGNNIPFVGKEYKSLSNEKEYKSLSNEKEYKSLSNEKEYKSLSDIKKEISYQQAGSIEEKYKRLFPSTSKDIHENNKHYIEFLDKGTGIMLADNLFIKNKMITLSSKLLKDYSNPPQGWFISEKYDGIRGIWTGKELVARPVKKDGVLKGKVFSYVPKWFLNMLPLDVPLDGELWLGRGKFQEVSGLSNYKISKKITVDYLDSIWKNVKYMVFDIPNHKGSYLERQDTLKKCIDDLEIKHGINNQIIYSQNEEIKEKNDLEEYYKKYIENGAEGVIIREPNSLYECKRSKLMLKMKITNDNEAHVLEYQLGTEGKYKGLLGSLKCKLENGKVFNIGTGFSDIMRKEYNMKDSIHYIPLGSKINFAFMELTKEGIPRHPVYRGIRTDV